LKSIDYLKLVNTARHQRVGGRLAKPDSVLHAVIWWGALFNAVATILIGIVLDVMAVDFNFDFILVAVLGVVPVLIYFSIWLFLLDELPRFSRLMIGIAAFLISIWVAYIAFSELARYWFVLVPVFIYFAAIASVAFRQMTPNSVAN
jgi:hypothetical protein